jgi:rSAM/selenodomain-associated transferase 2
MSAFLSVSIIVPVLNEAELIDDFLRHLREVAPAAEIIVVDGGSRDGTMTIAQPLANIGLTTKPGRGPQMNAGAAVARGDVLLFVHADLRLPDDAISAIDRALSEPETVGGCFRLRFPRRPAIYRVSDSLGNLGVDLFGFALGDHAIFCRRDAFHEIGGYRDLPILEDAELYLALNRIGRMKQLAPEVRCSPRAYERFGPYRTTAAYFLILVLYVLGVPIPRLHAIYRWLRRAKDIGQASLTPAAQR